jgi:hypothetical protein
MQDDARLRKIGGRRPTGTRMSPGRRTGLGGTRAATYATSFQSVLQVHGKRDGSRGLEPGRFPPHLQNAVELQTGVRCLSDVADKCHSEFAGRQLPADAARSADGFHGRRDAAIGRKAFFGTSARQVGRGYGVERSTATGLGASFARIAGVGDLAGFARTRVQRDPGGAPSARRHGKIADQPRTHRAGAHSDGNGCSPELICGLIGSKGYGLELHIY